MNTKVRKQQKRNGHSPIQFNWKRQWEKKVDTALVNPIVQLALDIGMTLHDPKWQPGSAPYLIGRTGEGRIVEGKLSWYQPLGCCHHISYFALAIGVANYPDLTWRRVSGRFHTVPVGYDAHNKPRVVMDILLFADMSAEESIAFAESNPMTRKNDIGHILFAEQIVSAMQESIQPQATTGAKRDECEAAQVRAARRLLDTIGQMAEC